jgi:hypothetical protein
LNHLDLYLWGHLETRVYAAPVNKEDLLQNRIVDARQTIRIYFGIFELMRRSKTRRIEEYAEFHGENFEHSL